MKRALIFAAPLLLSGCIITNDGFFDDDDFDHDRDSFNNFDDDFGDFNDPVVSSGGRDDAFAFPVDGISRQQERDFLQGRALFDLEWEPHEIGPLFNDISCAGCHQSDGRAHPDTDGLLFRLSAPDGGPDPFYGGQFQPNGVNPTRGEGRVIRTEHLIHGEYPDGTPFTLAEPTYEFVDLNYGLMSLNVMVSPRLAQQNVGLGLLEAIPEQDILALEDPADRDGDGISGRANFAFNVEFGDFELGRFGWKSNQPSLRHQNAGAFHGDLGMTSDLFPESPCTDLQDECLESDFFGIELREDQLQKVTTYTQLLAPPAQRFINDSDVQRGEQLFRQANCSGCHIEQFVTDGHPVRELNGRVIRPYTDLLLHDMGEGLADHRPDFDANGREWRTPPLWGIGHLQEINGHQRLMHDGRADGVEEAILWHGGEAANSRAAFMDMSAQDRAALVAFVNSL